MSEKTHNTGVLYRFVENHKVIFGGKFAEIPLNGKKFSLEFCRKISVCGKNSFLVEREFFGFRPSGISEWKEISITGIRKHFPSFGKENILILGIVDLDLEKIFA